MNPHIPEPSANWLDVAVLPLPAGAARRSSLRELLKQMDPALVERLPLICVPALQVFSELFTLTPQDTPSRWRISKVDLAALAERADIDLQNAALAWSEHPAWAVLPSGGLSVNPFDLYCFLATVVGLVRSLVPGTELIMEVEPAAS